jgi:hypothetical protein
MLVKPPEGMDQLLRPLSDPVLNVLAKVGTCVILCDVSVCLCWGSGGVLVGGGVPACISLLRLFVCLQVSLSVCVSKKCYCLHLDSNSQCTFLESNLYFFPACNHCPISS